MSGILSGARRHTYNRDREAEEDPIRSMVG